MLHFLIVTFMIWALNLGPECVSNTNLGESHNSPGFNMNCDMASLTQWVRNGPDNICSLWMLYLWRWGETILSKSNIFHRKQCWEFLQVCIIKKKAGSSKVREAFNHTDPDWVTSPSPKRGDSEKEECTAVCAKTNIEPFYYLCAVTNVTMPIMVWLGNISVTKIKGSKKKIIKLKFTKHTNSTQRLS